MADVIIVNEDNFQSEVVESSVPVLVDFWAPWCGYCTKLAPVLDELAIAMTETMKVAKINVDENRAIAQRHNVMSLPTMLLFENGRQVEKLTGFMPKTTIISKLTPLL